MTEKKAKALVLAGYGMNCDNETRYVFEAAGAEADIIHINELIKLGRSGRGLSDYHVFAVGGGFAWADDHGAGVLLALKLRTYLGEQIDRFIKDGKLVIGICNGFQALANIGLLPGLESDSGKRSVALAANDCGNFRDQWVKLKVDPGTKCVFTAGIDQIDMPVRHGEGKFYAPAEIIESLKENGQAALRYASEVKEGTTNAGAEESRYVPAAGSFPDNPNGSLDDIAGICDSTGRVFGLMPHPEAFNHLTNHPDWTRKVDLPMRLNKPLPKWEGEGLKIFQNAVRYVEENLL